MMDGKRAAWSMLLSLTAAASAAADAVPVLTVDKAVYSLETGVLQYAFTFANPSDSVLFLDCQVPPRASLQGNTLLLDFDRSAMPAADSGSKAADAADFPPQRVGRRQTFQGQRRLDRLLGTSAARPAFPTLQLRMAYYPERDSGDGEAYLIDRQRQVVSKPQIVSRRGKVPPPNPPRVLRHRIPAPD
jgi:hypothetical protein